MDFIAQAIVSGIVGNFASDALKAAYKRLKDAIASKFGKDSDLVEAVNKLEAKPDSEGRKATLIEEVAASKANDDAQLVQLAQHVIDLVKQQPGGQQVITQTVSNVKNNVMSGSGNATGNFTEPRP